MVYTQKQLDYINSQSEFNLTTFLGDQFSGFVVVTIDEKSVAIRSGRDKLPSVGCVMSRRDVYLWGKDLASTERPKLPDGESWVVFREGRPVVLAGSPYVEAFEHKHLMQKEGRNDNSRTFF